VTEVAVTRATEESQKDYLSRVAPRIRLVILDVDGVMTDGGLYVGVTAGGEPVEMKKFEITDGLGVHLLKEAGIQVAIVSGRYSACVQVRAEELKIDECHMDPGAAKLPIVEKMLARLGIGWNETAFLGDDLPDLSVLRRVALPGAVANAAPEVMKVARWVGSREGGRGAVREFSHAILAARGEWDRLVLAYEEERSR
jgi:3-deoxy-D-manno-octulosonate 8-phosphate phosphatase (KDO 8-P phosphatase)